MTEPRRPVDESFLVNAVVIATILVVGLILIASIAGAQPPPKPDGPVLSEVDTLRADNLKLRAQILELQRGLAQCQLDAGTAALNSDRTKLEAEFRAVLKPKDGEVFDWNSLTWRPPADAPKISTPPPVPQKK